MPDFRKATSSMPLLTKLTLALLVLVIAMCSVMLIGNATADRGFASGGNLTAADGGLMLSVVFALIAMSMLVRTRPVAAIGGHRALGTAAAVVVAHSGRRR